MKLRLSSIILIIFLFFNSLVVAAQDDFYIKSVFDASTGDVLISGNGSGEIVVMILSDGNVLSDGSVSDNISSLCLPVDIFQIHSTGEFSKTVQLPDNTPGGKYRVVAPTLGKGVNDWFIYINEDEVSQILPLASGSYEEFSNAVYQSAEKLGIDVDDEVYINNKESICKILYAIQDNYTEVSDFYNDYYMSRALHILTNSSQSEAEKIIKDNELYFGISYNDDIVLDERLSSEAKNELMSILNAGDYTKLLSPDKSFADCLEEAKALACIKVAAYRQDIEDVIKTDFSHLFKNCISNSQYYGNIKTKQDVFSKMMDYTYNGFNDVLSGFEKAAKEVYDNEKKASQSNKENVKPSTGPVGGGVVGIPSGVTEPLWTPSDTAESAQSVNGIIVPKSNATSSFADLKEDHWGYKAVSALADAGVISGYENNTFAPDGKVTRAEFTKMISLAFTVTYGEASFKDVSVNDWHYPYISAAASCGIIKGNGTEFAPDAPLTREDAAVIIYRALNYRNIELTGTSNFTDNTDISLYAYTAVGALRSYSVVLGTTGNLFLPKNDISRIEAAQMIYKAVCTANSLIK